MDANFISKWSEKENQFLFYVHRLVGVETFDDKIVKDQKIYKMRKNQSDI